MNLTQVLAELTFAAINYIVVSSISASNQKQTVTDLKTDLRTTKEDLMAELKDTRENILSQVKDNRNEIENLAVKSKNQQV